MANKPLARSSDGCWTCRLRRKKCDEARPHCAACAALEISCLYSDEKPEWMDGGERQAKMAEEVKAEVKKKAAWRRERKYLSGIEPGIEELSMADAISDLTFTSHHDESGGIAPTGADKSTSPASNSWDSPQNSSSDGTSNNTPPSSTSEPGVYSAVDGMYIQGQHFPATAQGASPAASASTVAYNSLDERELLLLTNYLDYVFPFLFPFYRPALLQSGRGWLLILLMRKRTLLHSALSLSTYFFAVATENLLSGHESCREHNRSELEKQHELTLKELQHDVAVVNQKGVGSDLVESARIMESIVQLVVFEVAVTRRVACTESWMVHLDGAFVMFEQIMEHHGSSGEGDARHYCWHAITAQLRVGSQMPTLGFSPSGDPYPYSSDQAAMRFFTSLLLFADVISATALETSPRLFNFHGILLDSISGNFSGVQINGPQIDLESVIGVKNDVVTLLAQVADLHAWKKEMTKTGSLSMVQLVTRASQIETLLRGLIQCLERERQNAGSGSDQPTTNPIDFISQYNVGLPIVKGSSTTWTSLVWAHATLTYLSTVVSGWQPSCPEVRASVAATMTLLAAAPAPASVRSVVWPFCVTGCLALPEEEGIFRGMVEALGPLSNFGMIAPALRVMEGVWTRRGQLGPEWTMAEGLRDAGTAVMLF
ncbi:fungal-specific transcription factor domain-containing protein [Diaporthe sp. PMI_573]|nr:fungal-specific transcription factor domain-containing protein [Diaporthaceae sp. PMI_573]